jgi:hypothetical protein
MTDKTRSLLIQIASDLYAKSEEARDRGTAEEPTVATHDYWQGVTFGLEMAVATILTAIETYDRARRAGDAQ